MTTLTSCASRRIVPSAQNPESWGVEVTWHGHSCFSLRDGNGRVIAVDPFDTTVGYQTPRLCADIVVVTHDHFDHNYTPAAEAIDRKSLKIIDSTGTFRAGGFEFDLIVSDHDDKGGRIHGLNGAAAWTMGGLRFVHLGDWGRAALTPDEMRALGGADVLFVPVGGAVTVNAVQAKALVNKLKPRAVFPMHYGRSEVRFYRFEPVDPFLALFPAGRVRRLPGASVRLTAGELGDPGEPVVFVPVEAAVTNCP